jgi:hypothetical protein
LFGTNVFLAIGGDYPSLIPNPHVSPKAHLALVYWVAFIPTSPQTLVHFPRDTIHYRSLVYWDLGINEDLMGLGETPVFIQPLGGLSPLIPTKTLVPNKGLRDFEDFTPLNQKASMGTIHTD